MHAQRAVLCDIGKRFIAHPIRHREINIATARAIRRGGVRQRGGLALEREQEGDAPLDVLALRLDRESDQLFREPHGEQRGEHGGVGRLRRSDAEAGATRHAQRRKPPVVNAREKTLCGVQQELLVVHQLDETSPDFALHQLAHHATVLLAQERPRAPVLAHLPLLEQRQYGRRRRGRRGRRALGVPTLPPQHHTLLLEESGVGDVNDLGHDGNPRRVGCDATQLEQRVDERLGLDEGQRRHLRGQLHQRLQQRGLELGGVDVVAVRSNRESRAQSRTRFPGGRGTWRRAYRRWLERASTATRGAGTRGPPT